MGRTIKAAVRITAVICSICFLFLSIVVTPASAGAAPDTFTITTSAVASGLKETGDYLFFCEYEASWALEASYSDDPISETIVIQLIDPATDDAIASTSPYPYYNSGYDKGLVAIYLSRLEAISANITWETGYIFQMVTNPGEFTSVKSIEYIIPTNEYCNSGTGSQSANRDWIREYCLNTANTLENNWGASTALTLQSVNMVLSAAGESYYIRVMPGLRDLVPHLFLATAVIPSYTEIVYTGSHSTALETQWSGTDMVSQGIEGIDGLTDGNGIFATNLLILGSALALIVLAGAILKAIAPGLLGGSILMMVGTDLGLLEVALLSVFLLMFLLYAVNKTVGLNRT